MKYFSAVLKIAFFRESNSFFLLLPFPGFFFQPLTQPDKLKPLDLIRKLFQFQVIYEWFLKTLISALIKDSSLL